MPSGSKKCPKAILAVLNQSLSSWAFGRHWDDSFVSGRSECLSERPVSREVLSHVFFFVYVISALGSKKGGACFGFVKSQHLTWHCAKRKQRVISARPAVLEPCCMGMRTIEAGGVCFRRNVQLSN